jgi:hypothetical protein
LQFSDITLSQGTGSNASDTRITLNSTQETLALLIGVQANSLTNSAFTTLPTPLI